MFYYFFCLYPASRFLRKTEKLGSIFEILMYLSFLISVSDTFKVFKYILRFFYGITQIIHVWMCYFLNIYTCICICICIQIELVVWRRMKNSGLSQIFFDKSSKALRHNFSFVIFNYFCNNSQQFYCEYSNISRHKIVIFYLFC